MRNFKNWLAIVMLISTTIVFGQTKLTGKVVDESNQPLPGASIVVSGTTVGTSTDFDGNFTFETDALNGKIVVSFIGYENQAVTFKGSKKLGTISLSPSSESLNEIIITGVIDVAKERQTPVAVSTIKASEIIEKLGSQEFPEILNSTPSVYATKSGGGFGDSRINIRGFDQRNTAVLINGVPVNDMETGAVYWSNWAGLADVTSAMQVQRGLGSSKLAISSVGGTINIITKTSDQKEGGTVATSVGNDGYQKWSGSYSTGLMENGFSASFVLSRTTGDGYTEGTAFEGHNYFIGIGKKLDKHNLMFTFTGAPQWHNQHSRAIEIWRYQDYGTHGQPNTKFNDAWGTLDGKEFSFRKNFYHKPVMSINWDWEINETTTLGTVAYASWGRGGGSGPIGDVNNIRDYDYRLRDENGHFRMDDIVAWNSGKDVPDFGARRNNITNDNSNGLTRRSSMNSHNWYGVIANLHNVSSENFSWDFGIDARTYKGIHYRVVSDLLGASNYVDNKDINNPNNNITKYVDAAPNWNPWANIKDQQKIEYYNDGGAHWLGAFMQAEYKTEKVSTFIQAGISNQAFQRIDYFNLVPAEQESDWEAILGGNIKAGLNYNIDEMHNVFANAGYYSKQPQWNAVYPSFVDNNINDGLTNEIITGIEAGYGFKHENFRANVNLYRTSWKDRFYRQKPSGQDNYIDFEGIEEIHSGIEFEGSMKFDFVTIRAMISLGDWEYKGDVTGTEYDDDRNVVGSAGTTFYLDGVKVGDAAQTTGRLGFDFNLAKDLKFDLTASFYENNYAAIDAGSFSKVDHKGSLELPAYRLLDAGISYKVNLKNNDAINFRLNINNLADELYISESQTNIHVGENNNTDTFLGVNTANRVYWGFGRTWNFSMRYNF